MPLQSYKLNTTQIAGKGQIMVRNKIWNALKCTPTEQLLQESFNISDEEADGGR